MDLFYYKNYVNKNILVTGGSGYIGSRLVEKLSKAPCKLTVLTSKTDIRLKKTWEKYLTSADIIFHLAAQTSSQFSNKNPVLDTKINLLPVVNLIEVCCQKKITPDIIFSGTVTQVGLTRKYPVNEQFKDKPITVYDINKLAAEKYLQYYSDQLGGRAVTLRLANVYGPGPASSRKDRGILNMFIKRAIIGEDLTIYGRGDYLRDYVYIDDVVEAFLLAGINIDKLKGGYYLIGSGKGYSIKKMVGLIKENVVLKTGKKAKIKYLPSPPGFSPIEFRNFVADSSRFIKITRWQAKTSLSSGIRQTIEYLLKER